VNASNARCGKAATRSETITAELISAFSRCAL
jgi:hypothetical protein